MFVFVPPELGREESHSGDGRGTTALLPLVLKSKLLRWQFNREAETEEEGFCSQGGKREKMKTGRVGAERGKEEWGGEGGQWKEERGEWVQYPLAKGEGGKGLGGKG